MLIPYSTDAPLYHLPIATGVVIAANVISSILFWTAPGSTQEEFVLLYGDGLHPIQWISSIFVHAGLIHLIGNMIFLWAFGLIVEGKVGAKQFLLLYLGVGVAQSGIEQIMMLGAEEGASIGASSAIFALLGLAVVWAPRNELDTLLFIWIYPLTIEISVLTFGYIYLALQLIGWSLSGFGVSSESLHLMGLIPGLAIGWWMADSGRVDCEGFDLPSLFAGREGKPIKQKVKQTKPDPEKEAAAKRQRDQQLAEARARVTQHLESGNVDAALQLLEKVRAVRPDQQLEQRELRLAIRASQQQKDWTVAKALMKEHLARFEDSRDPLRLQLARIFIQVEQRPVAALRLLSEVDCSALKPSAVKLFNQLVAKAEQLREEGVIELKE